MTPSIFFKLLIIFSLSWPNADIGIIMEKEGPLADKGKCSLSKPCRKPRWARDSFPGPKADQPTSLRGSGWHTAVASRQVRDTGIHTHGLCSMPDTHWHTAKGFAGLASDDLSVQSKGLSCIPEFNCHLPKHCMGLFQRKLTGPFRPHPQVPEAIRPATAPQNLGTPCRRSRSPGTDSLGQRQLDLAGYEHNGRCFAMILQHTEQKWCSYKTHHNSVS